MAQSTRTSTPVFKTCSRCRQLKPATAFYGCNAECDKLQNTCIPCDRISHRAYMRRCRERHREKVNKYQRDWEHKIHEEAGCYKMIRTFYPGYRFIKALEELYRKE